ncbi:MAG: LysR family transcriptional regulator [Burkholderiaceae bacterium]
MARRQLASLRMRHLSLISALGSADHLHGAAEQANMTQPTATRLLRDAEDILGAVLFERLPRGMRPTPLGLDAIAFADRILAQLEAFGADLKIKRDGGHGLLIIGAIMGAAPHIVAQAVADLKRRHPLLTIRLLGETSDMIMTMLGRGELDLAVGRFTGPMQHNLFSFEHLAYEKLCVVARDGHPLLADPPTDLRDLADMPWVLQPEPTIARQLLESAFAGRGMTTPVNRIEVASIFAALQLVQKSDAVAMLSRPVVEDYLRAGFLRELPLRIDWKLSGFGLLTRRSEQLSGVAKELADRLRAIAAAQAT